MVKYHPDARFLTDYTAGSLPQSQALCVSTHLHYCQSCRGKVRELSELGAELFMRQARSPVSGEAFEQLMDRISTTNLHTEPAAGKPLPETSPRADEPDGARTAGASTLPHAINKLTRGNLENLYWHNIGKGFRYTQLNLGDPKRETTLLHIRAGRNVPHHRHAGDEITVILKGSFSDYEDKYGVGDFIVRTSGEAHRPVASQDEDCLCLATLDEPLIMSNWFYRLLMPLINRRHAQLAQAR